jgi:hypothetical protein
VQHTVVGAPGTIPPAVDALPDAAHAPPDAVTLAATFRAVAARLLLHWPTTVPGSIAGAAQSLVAETDTLPIVHATPVGAPQAHEPAHVRVSLPPPKYT